MMHRHQYVDRRGQAVVTETLFADQFVRFLYSSARERAPALFRHLVSARSSSLLATLRFDTSLASPLLGNRRFLRSCGVNLAECVEPAEFFTTPRRIFERQIRYWECRPMPTAWDMVVSPADARALVGGLRPSHPLFLKGKFFDLEELLGQDRPPWIEAFREGDFAVFRLTPEKYHYSHTPVAGRVEDVYAIDGLHHSCNPGAVVEVATPYSKNRRAITILQTDVPGGTGVGLVAMIEVVALMVGDVVQAYSSHRYDAPRPISPGMLVARGQPKSLFRPGSSTDVLLFQKGRVWFAPDLIMNRAREDVQSRFTTAFGQPLVETDIRVRSLLARRVAGG